MDTEAKYGGAGGVSEIYFWVVPARAAGIWQWELPVGGKPVAYELKLDQKYQALTGSLSVDGKPAKLLSARMRGEEIRLAFTADVNGSQVKHDFVGKVAGDAVIGSARLSGARLQGQHDWSARRIAPAAVSALQ
jgi:hypothetical protein